MNLKLAYGRVAVAIYYRGGSCVIKAEFSFGLGTELDSGNGGGPPSDITGYVQVVSVKLPGESVKV